MGSFLPFTIFRLDFFVFRQGIIIKHFGVRILGTSCAGSEILILSTRCSVLISLRIITAARLIMSVIFGSVSKIHLFFQILKTTSGGISYSEDSKVIVWIVLSLILGHLLMSKDIARSCDNCIILF